MTLVNKAVLVSAAMFALVGCKTEFNGSTQVNEKMTVKLKRGYATLPVGKYSSTLKFKSKKKAELEIRTNGQKNNPELPIAIPKYAQVPDYNGPISWKANEIEQTFDVDGNLNSKITNSERRRTRETCQEQVPVRECWHTPQGPQCRTGWRYEQGWRDVEYYDRYVEQTLVLALKDPKSARVLANLSGFNNETQRIETWSSYCRVYGYPFNGMDVGGRGRW